MTKFCEQFLRRASSWASFVESELASIKRAGLWKEERVITSSQRSLITVNQRSKPVLNFCANNYLGLSDHPEVIEAAG